MSEWKECRLGDICEVFGRIGFRGYTSKDLVETYEDGAISLSPSNIVQGEIELSKCTYIRWDKYEESPEIKIQVGDIIFVKTGSSYGRSALIRSVEHPMTLNPQLVVLKNIKVNPIILSYVIKGREFQGKVYGIIGGSAIPTLSQKRLAELTIKLPSKEKQNRISDILLSFDSKIFANRRICENLEAQAQALFKHWFIDFAPFKDGKFVESELGMIPEGWRVTTIGKVCKCELGGTPSRANKHYWGGNIAWINSGEVNKFRICQASEYITEEGLNHSATKILPAKTTVLAITGATLGQVSLLEIDSCANQSVVGITENEQIPYTFIYPLIKSRIKERMQMQTGGAQQHINKGNIQDMRIVLCPKPILSEYHSIAQELFGQIGNLCFENLRLSTLRDTLLPRLMSGQIKL